MCDVINDHIIDHIIDHHYEHWSDDDFVLVAIATCLHDDTGRSDRGPITDSELQNIAQIIILSTT